MNRRNVLKTSVGAALALILSKHAGAQQMAVSRAYHDRA